MKRTFAVSASALAAFLFVALTASGGALAKEPPVFPPKKGGVYVGTIKSVFDLAVTLKVSKTGKTASVKWFCGTGRGSITAPNIVIDSTGRFKATGNLWSVGGRFVSTTGARVTISDIGCGGSKGTTKLTLK